MGILGFFVFLVAVVEMRMKKEILTKKEKERVTNSIGEKLGLNVIQSEERNEILLPSHKYVEIGRAGVAPKRLCCRKLAFQLLNSIAKIGL